MEDKSIKIIVYRWGGSWGPFKVKIPCGECALTSNIIDDVLGKELKFIKVDVEVKDWLSHWWEPLKQGAWHAPIVVVENSLVSEGQALNRGVLIQSVVEKYVKDSEISGTHIFGKENCPHCKRAKEYLDGKIAYEYHDVIESSKDLYEMLGRVKSIIGPKTPVTVPQIWMDGKYIGGADELKEKLSTQDD